MKSHAVSGITAQFVLMDLCAREANKITLSVNYLPLVCLEGSSQAVLFTLACCNNRGFYV